VDAPKPRRTHLGHVPSAWLRPRRREVVIRLLIVIAYDVALVMLGGALEPLDTRFLYHPSDVATILDAMGDAGRAEYRLFLFADLAFIAVYASALVTWLKFLRVRDALPKGVPSFVGAAPALFDLGETVGALVLLGSFPDVADPWPTVVAIATPMKWISAGAVVVVALWGERTRWQHRDDPR
jgi:hypothetical protein